MYNTFFRKMFFIRRIFDEKNAKNRSKIGKKIDFKQKYVCLINDYINENVYQFKLNNNGNFLNISYTLNF